MGHDVQKILLVDDERTNLDVLCRILQSDDDNTGRAALSDYRLIIAKNGPAALKKALRDKPDLILLDIIMPGMNGFEVLSVLKESELTRSIPVIVITGLDSVEDEEKGFQLGAVDYITKPFHKSLVKARVKTHLRIVEQMHIIEQLGLIDALTNIPNRRNFDSRLTAEWGSSIRENTPLSLLMIDVDHFKKFNDKYGHQKGDVVLKMVAHIINTSIRRSSDFAARWGGEEFVVLLPRTDLDGALDLAETIRMGIEQAAIPGTETEAELSVQVSIGVTSVMPFIESSMIDFVEQADKALYAAKAAGRNRVCS